MPIKRIFTSPPNMILVGVALVMLIVLSVAAFTTPSERERMRSAATPQVSSVYATMLDGQRQAIFEEKCQGCHSIGEGIVVGPDLKGVTERRDRDWLISFIVLPDELIEQGDPIANQLVEEYNGILMPNLGLSADEAEEVLVYIEAQSGGEPSTPPPFIMTGDPTYGRDIFTGSMLLKSGGAACISCHNVDGIAALGGGAVAKDLTEAFSTYGGAGLTAVLKAAPFPLMKAIYEVRPLDDDEVANLVAFLGETADAQQPAAEQSPLIFIVIGIAGLLLIILIIQTIWRGRLSGVRQSLVKGGSK